MSEEILSLRYWKQILNQNLAKGLAADFNYGYIALPQKIKKTLAKQACDNWHAKDRVWICDFQDELSTWKATFAEKRKTSKNKCSSVLHTQKYQGAKSDFLHCQMTHFPSQLYLVWKACILQNDSFQTATGLLAGLKIRGEKTDVKAKGLGRHQLFGEPTKAGINTQLSLVNLQLLWQVADENTYIFPREHHCVESGTRPKQQPAFYL